MAVDTLEQHEALVTSLMDVASWPQGGGHRRRIDTHISSVILAGDVAYKIKKPLDLGFLNFVSLDDRHSACEEELRLNRRLAPQLYLAVCAITGSTASPQIEGPGPPIDWAVRMRRFDPDAVLSNAAIELTPRLVDTLAADIAQFHLSAAVDTDALRSAESAGDAMRQNFAQIAARLPALPAAVGAIEEWTLRELERLAVTMRERRAGRHIRECHGDLHLGNIALIDGQPVVFDAIEFNAALRWIDTICDLAFLSMDLHHRSLDALATRLLDRYLQHSGDFAALALLQLYEVYRSMVRAKIAAIRHAQLAERAERALVRTEFDSYIELAARLSLPRSGALLITHGVSGSGKSHATADLVDQLPVVRIRSDVERKRLVGEAATSDISARGGYSRELTERTYRRLAASARQVIEAGYIALVDATFLDRRQRERFASVADERHVPFVIIDCDAPASVLRERITRRRTRSDNVSDAGLAVLDQQLARRDPLHVGELARSIRVDPDRPLDVGALRRMIGY